MKINLNLFYKNNCIYAVWLVLLVFLSLTYAAQQSIYIPLVQMDGAFQTASGLFRINDGYMPGRDFYPYLGLLLTWVLYPIFWLSGADLSSTVFASHFMVFFGTSFSVFSFCYFSRDKNLIISLIFSILFSFIVACAYERLNIVLLERVTPGNSLRPLRAFVAPLILTLVFLCIEKIKSLRIQIPTVSLLCGGALLWSNDFGYPTAMVAGVLYLYCLRRKSAMTMANVAIFVILSGLSFFFLSAILTAGNPLSMLMYNIDIARDQSWYFSPGDERFHIYTLSGLFSAFIIPFIGIKTLALPLLIVAYLRTKKIKLLFQFSIGFVFFSGAIISAVGGRIDPAYAGAYNFWVYSLVLIYAVNFIVLIIKFRERFIGFDGVYKYSPIFLMLIGSLVLSYRVNVIRDDIFAAQNNNDYTYDAKLGGFIPWSWGDYLKDALRDDRPAIEDFWGIRSAYQHSYANAPTDAVIHALGSKREKFNAAARGSDVIITASPAVAGAFMDWLVSVNWVFYSNILENYSLERRFIYSDKWVRSDKKLWPAQPCSVTNAGISLPGAKPGYYDVSILFDRSAITGAGFYTIKNNINFTYAANGYVPVNRYVDTFRFPAAVINTPENDVEFNTGKVGVVNGLAISSCSARKIVGVDEFWFPEIDPGKLATPYGLTDMNWTNGVSNTSAAFFLLKTPVIKIIPGDHITFKNGDVREVVSVTESGQYLNVNLTGDKLDGNSVGYPNKIAISHN